MIASQHVPCARRMWRPKRTLALGVLSAAMVAAISPGAWAARFRECSDDPVRIGGGNVLDFTIFASSMSPTSPAGTACTNAINKWNAVDGMSNKFAGSFTLGPTTSFHGDLRSDALLVSRSNIGGRNGLTHIIYNAPLCTPGIAERIIEADVMVANDMIYVNPAEDTLTTNNGRTTFLHEFGHALGLLHNQDYNTMRTVQPRPVFGGLGEHQDVFPDDAAGGRALYPSSGSTHVNIFTTASMRDVSTDTIQPNTGVGPVFSCTSGGGQITILATAGNNGQVNITQTERWFISYSSTAYANGFFFAEWAGSTYNAGSAISVWRTLTLPALAVGTYRLFHGVDMLNQVVEKREDDNVSRQPLLIQVVPC